jgi:hypothetical protein
LGWKLKEGRDENRKKRKGKKRKEKKESLNSKEEKKEKNNGGSKANCFRSLQNYGDLKWRFTRQIK